MNEAERTTARAALISGIRLSRLIDDLDRMKYRELVDEHRRRLEGNMPVSIATHDQMLEPGEREAATKIAGKIFEESAAQAFWSADAGDVLTRVSCDLNDALFLESAEDAGVFNLFQLVTMTLAERMRHDAAFRDMVFSSPTAIPRSGQSGLITRSIGIAIDDHEHERISRKQLLLILQDSIESGDILAEANEPYVEAFVLPLVKAGVLRMSPHLEERLNRLGSHVSIPGSRRPRRGWKFWL